ncbi:MAG: DUF835 domain-containing protein [Methanomassiliicoccales archaeon]|nr:MAG: DUF835 domain-containing protein [Methanomassiliicoccales archaeon]
MSEEEQFAKGFILGYEAGLKEAYDSMISLATKKCYTSTELLLVVKNQRVCVPDKVLIQKRRILRETGVDLITERAMENVEIERGVAPGSCLFIKEQTPSMVFRIFREVVESGAKGLCVSRDHPDKLRSRVPPGCDFIWLSKFDCQDDPLKEITIQPNNLVGLYTTIKKFFLSNKDRASVVMMDGINFLVTNNDFNGVLKTIQKLRDEVYMYKSVFIISADPGSMLPTEVRQIEYELQNVFDVKRGEPRR